MILQQGTKTCVCACNVYTYTFFYPLCNLLLLSQLPHAHKIILPLALTITHNKKDRTIMNPSKCNGRSLGENILL